MHDTTITIRTARPEDRPALARLIADPFERTAELAGLLSQWGARLLEEERAAAQR